VLRIRALALPLILMLAACEEPAVEPVCDITEYPARQLRLLNAREYRSTVRDLLPSSEASCSSDIDCNVQDQSCVGETCLADPCALHTFVLPVSSPVGSVHVAGSFNGWPASPEDGVAMTWAPALGLYYGKAVLPDGTHAYKFVLDGATWIADPSNPQTTPDGFGGNNSVVVVECEGAPPEGDGAFDPAAGFPVTARSEGYPFDNDARSGLVTAVHVEQYLSAGEQLAARASSSLPELLGCDPAAASCIADWIAEFGRRAYRRPLRPDEQERMEQLADAWPDRAVGVGVALQVFLSSPSFLYRSELGTSGPDGYALTAYEVATLLSYTLLGTTPSAALLDRAGAGELDTVEQRVAEARRMLGEPEARELLRAFAVQWLGVEPVLGTDKSSSLFPGMTANLRGQMLQETADLFEHVAFDGTGTFSELLTADYTFVGPELAALYGVSADGGAVPLSDGRAGILGHASVLATQAHSDQTSPIRRGLFVRQRLLCEEFGAPPPDAGGVPDVDPSATTRQRFAQHSESPACSGCHRYIDPLGFGFEEFDAIGAHRTSENGAPIDSRGTLVDVEGRGSGTSDDFSSLATLGALLASSEAAPACFARQWMRFQQGHLEGPEGQCIVDNLSAELAASGGDIRELLVALVRSPAFVKRAP
jgi:hypothetical protein